jgi:hypothetical protein
MNDEWVAEGSRRKEADSPTNVNFPPRYVGGYERGNRFQSDFFFVLLERELRIG